MLESLSFTIGDHLGRMALGIRGWLKKKSFQFAGLSSDFIFDILLVVN
jgi:hypothetical protein